MVGATRIAAAPALAACLLAAPEVAEADPVRDDDPVVVSGAVLPEFAGEPVERLGIFRWNPAAQAFEPIPFQLDQVVDEVFNPGTSDAFVERMYDVLGHDDGLLDDNDEIAFLFGDAGPRAPGGPGWVEGAGDTRVEVQVASVLPGAPPVTRWAYVFAGAALPRSGVSYVQWAAGADAPILTTAMTVVYQGPWLLTGLAIAPPCGSGRDLIDRVKGRVVTNVSAQEDEEMWNASSSFLGGLVGLVRAVRYVRGGASGINMIHHDVVYRAQWRRHVNIRIHPLQSASLYIDWLPIAGATFYSPSAASGVPVDGVPDAVASAYVSWTLTASPEGGLAVVHDLPPSPFYRTREAIYRDDASYDDRIPRNPSYADEDDSAYGDSGLRLAGISDTGLDAIPVSWIASVLCAGVGDEATGEAYRRFFDNPLQLSAVPQPRILGSIASLACARDGDDVVLSWQIVPGAASYRVYASDDPSAPKDSWTLLGETVAPLWRIAGAAGTPSAYFDVVPVGPSGAAVP